MAQISANYLVYLHAHKGQPFCMSCLARLSPERITREQVEMIAGKSFLEGPSRCSGCGQQKTVLLVEEDYPAVAQHQQ